MLDRALVSTYKSKGITQDPETQQKEPPLMEDLYKILMGMETPDALDLAARSKSSSRGSFVGIFDKQTNIEINNSIYRIFRPRTAGCPSPNSNVCNT
jgi:hypothetical protein